MTIEVFKSYDVYRKIAEAPAEKKEDVYRYEMMMPFKGKWDCYHIPIKAEKEGGYDIIMASEMLGLLPPGEVDYSYLDVINELAKESLWDNCKKSIEESLKRFEKANIELKVKDYLFSILLGNPKSPYFLDNCDGYCGDGGIPGYIMGWIIPSEDTIRRLPAALAHETNHNVRFQHIVWKNDITLGEMLVSEGLAENFATSIFGEEFLGPWVSKTDRELMPLVKEIIYEGLNAKGLDNITAYLYGDDMARMLGYPQVGLPYCAGYAVGYYLVKFFLKKTGISIEKATVMDAFEILNQVEEFWREG